MFREIISRKTPFSDMSEQQIILGVSQRGLRPAIPEDCIPEYKTLMTACWSQKPADRPSFETILIHLRSIADDRQDRIVPTIVDSPAVRPRSTETHTEVDEDRMNTFWKIDYEELQFDTKDVIGVGKSATVYKGIRFYEKFYSYSTSRKI